ncbi:MAG: hypothetical protein J6C85_03485 [Alphaproteobacteria bacterium]|nr:hypothetical protein [Alphaproteobacteria bacterium]
MLCFFNKHLVPTISGICLLLYLTAGVFFTNFPLTLFERQYLLIAAFLVALGGDDKQRFILLVLAALFSTASLAVVHEEAFLLMAELTGIGFLFWTNRKNKVYFPFFIILTALVFHLYYLQSIAVDYHQHDLDGILYYMRQLLLTEDGLFKINPWNMYYLFHQPLHFIIIGQVYTLGLYLFEDSATALKGLQYVSLFYVTLSSVFAVRILKEFKLPALVFYAAVLFFCFNPTLFLFSGYLSDDPPAFFWGILFLYNILIWYKNETNLHLIFAALCFALGVLTKLSILIMVPAVCFLFCCKFFMSKDKKKVLAQICLFIIVCVPLALIWVIRNHVLFDMSFYNIPDTSPSGQNFKYLTFGERIGDFSQLFIPFINSPYTTEKNMWLALVKTELFGEWDLSLTHLRLAIPALLLYLLTLLLKVATLFCAFLLLRKKNFTVLHFFFVLIYFCVWGYSFKYALDYPYACSTDYRLFATLMLPETLITVFIIPKNRQIAVCYFAGSVAYTVLSAFVYIFSV